MGKSHEAGTGDLRTAGFAAVVQVHRGQPFPTHGGACLLSVCGHVESEWCQLSWRVWEWRDGWGSHSVPSSGRGTAGTKWNNFCLYHWYQWMLFPDAGSFPGTEKELKGKLWMHKTLQLACQYELQVKGRSVLTSRDVAQTEFLRFHRWSRESNSPPEV